MNFSVSGSAAKRQGQGSRREQWEQARGPGGSDFSGRCQQAAEGTRHQTGEGSDDPGWGWGPEVREAHGKRGFQGWARAELYAGHGVPVAGQRERGRGLPGRGAGPGSALLRFGGGFASPSLMVPALGMAPWRFLPQCLV